MRGPLDRLDPPGGLGKKVTPPPPPTAPDPFRAFEQQSDAAKAPTPVRPDWWKVLGGGSVPQGWPTLDAEAK